MTDTPTPGAAAELPVVSSDTANRALGIYYQMMPSEAAKLTDELRERMRCVLLCFGADAQRCQLDALREEVARLTKERDDARAGFKNFHRSLCARFGYVHDEVDWFRDQVSLEEHIAALKAQPTDADALMAQVDACSKAAAMLDRAIHSADCMCSPQAARKQYEAAREALRAKLAARKEEL